MKIAIAQLNPRIGDLAYNQKKILGAIATAKEKRADLVVFSELATTGYSPRDLLGSSQFIREVEKTNEAIVQASKGLAIIFGTVEKNPSKTGRPLHNSAFVAVDGQLVGNYRKQLLPYYSVFFEPRFFEPGKTAGIFEVQGKKIGVTVCEDIWNHSGRLKRDYNEEVLDPYRTAKIDLMVNVSASPFYLGHWQERLDVGMKTAKVIGADLILCNQVGGNDDVIFDGGSFHFSAQGSLKARLPVFSEAVTLLEENAVWPTVDVEWIERALVMGLKDFVTKCGFKKVILGLSGGIDSSVVATLAVRAFGKENVFGVLLPSEYTSAASNDDANELAKNLGIETNTFTLAIGGLQKEFEAVMENAGTALESTLENSQPRFRMTLLMAMSNQKQALLLNTSNKSEIATGFSTIYGDSCGAVSVIGDLTKHQVYELARYLNSLMPSIPERVLNKAPSAELKNDQKDEDILPRYAVLDRLVENFTAGKPTAAGLETAGNEVKKFFQFYERSEYKRRQFPPILRVSTECFGYGRDIPIAGKIPFSND